MLAPPAPVREEGAKAAAALATLRMRGGARQLFCLEHVTTVVIGGPALPSGCSDNGVTQ